MDSETWALELAKRIKDCNPKIDQQMLEKIFAGRGPYVGDLNHAFYSGQSPELTFERLMEKYGKSFIGL